MLIRAYKSLALLWSLIGAALFLRAVYVHGLKFWQSDLINWVPVSVLLSLTFTGFLIIANYRWAKWLQAVTIIPIFAVSADLCLFYVMRQRFETEFFVCFGTMCLCCMTWVLALVSRMDKRLKSPSNSSS
jgi:hypothetical protein